MGVEFEIKLRATPGLLQQLREQLPGEERVIQMQTTYYDTPAGAFAEKHCTLRCRWENEKNICTLKAPAQGYGRREWEVECGDIREGLEKLCKLGVPEELLLPAREGLIPVCGARFTRVAKLLQLTDGTAELALDRGVLMGGGKEIPLCEVEVERKSCSQRSCLAYAESLALRHGLVLEKDSKFARAQALYKGEEHGL